MKIFFQFILICISVGVIGSLAANQEYGALIVLSVFLVGLVGIWQMNRRSEERAWKNRPQRLCTNCLALAQPYKKENGVFYCPYCQADNPAPLESPFAQQHFARQQPSV